MQNYTGLFFPFPSSSLEGGEVLIHFVYLASISEYFELIKFRSGKKGPLETKGHPLSVVRWRPIPHTFLMDSRQNPCFISLYHDFLALSFPYRCLSFYAYIRSMKGREFFCWSVAGSLVRELIKTTA